MAGIGCMEMHLEVGFGTPSWWRRRHKVRWRLNQVIIQVIIQLLMNGAGSLFRKIEQHYWPYLINAGSFNKEAILLFWLLEHIHLNMRTDPSAFIGGPLPHLGVSEYGVSCILFQNVTWILFFQRLAGTSNWISDWHLNIDHWVTKLTEHLTQHLLTHG